MEEGEDLCVELSKHCERSYKKLSKKGDPKLLKAINSTIDELRVNPRLGKELTQDLKGMRSVRLNAFRYRIVYELNPGKIIIHVIDHRNDAYDDVAKYFGLGSYDDSEL